ncbi:MAG: aminotransferase class V-fold PLP-dependent enzyme [Gammaproteobacteria bacterium]|nr:aminotransferase class V-fold PLP-dependent enzyme [Gammaproteobacteria bacterium]MDH3447966.1 aminotransferase class V-fold PLP-dependent enzyme [Gammaproteobacteria bacterium]
MTIDKQSIIDDLMVEPGVIHLNNAGASLMPRCVLEAQVEHLRLEATIGGYEAEAARHEELEALYESVAGLINCRADEVAIVENATVGWMMAFYALRFERGDRILTAEAEYASNYLAYLQVARDKGVSIETIPSTVDGEICVDSLEAMLDERVRLISVTHIPTNGGLVNPVEAIGAVARAHNIDYLVDACQSAGQLALDVDAIQCDLLSATGRKFLRGPRGVGFLYVSKRILDRLHPPMIDLFSATWVDVDRYELRPDARRFENWENNYAARLGLRSAIDYALGIGLDKIEAEVIRLAASLRKMLARLNGVTVHDIGKRKCGIVSFSVAGVEAGEVATRLARDGIHVSVTTPDGTLIDATRRHLPDMVRASVHYFNQDTELDRLIEVVETIAAG